jgi:hypothetical protein
VPGKSERERWGQGGFGIKKGKARGGRECQMGAVSTNYRLVVYICELVPPERDSV